eukprot:TRINITY_DN15035_c0_g4_i1.p1 TRINITY_DN15035_c0_g4~~TRINITY_DN15035_c0_g4_i1.p1  ORF type:complete len:502 (+),score=134.42 TRINITY_DN15035_c0_g4_i1:387-1892(+)
MLEQEQLLQEALHKQEAQELEEQELRGPEHDLRGQEPDQGQENELQGRSQGRVEEPIEERGEEQEQNIKDTQIPLVDTSSGRSNNKSVFLPSPRGTFTDRDGDGDTSDNFSPRCGSFPPSPSGGISSRHLNLDSDQVMKSPASKRKADRLSRKITFHSQDKRKNSRTFSINEIQDSNLSQEEFYQLFEIKSDEECVIKVFPCTMKVQKLRTAFGTLFVTTNYLCFDATAFGKKLKEVIPLSKIIQLENHSNKRVDINVGGKNISLKEFGQNFKDAWMLISSLYKNKKESGKEEPVTVKVKEEEEGNTTGPSSLEPNDADWQLILSGTRSLEFSRGQTICEQEQEQCRIFHISKGKCKISKTNTVGKSITLEYLDPGSTFGEISFLVGGCTSACVTAEEDTIVHVIEGFFLNLIFDYHPDLSGRFHHYLAQTLLKRIEEREAGNTEKETLNLNAITTITTLPITSRGTSESNLEKVQVSPRPKRNTKSKILRKPKTNSTDKR